MGRLENFIPKLVKNTKITGGGGVSILQTAGEDSIPVEDEVAPFIKQINGHMSLREIFLFLNEKGMTFSVDKSLTMLRHLASLKILMNSEDFYEILNGSVAGRVHHPQSSRWDESYFSNERLIALIQKTTLFLKCDRSVAQNIVDVSELIHVQEGEKLIKEGTKSEDFFVLLSGEVGVFKDKDFLASLSPLAVFGESAAIFNKVRNADVLASEPSWLLKIRASKIVDTSSPESFEAFKGLKSRLILNQTLAANPLFRSLPTDVMQFFISKCRIEKYGREQLVIEQGDRSGDFYFVLQGSVSIIKDSMPVTSLGEGNHFGEVAAMFNQPRTASVLTETACTFLVLNQKALFEVLASHFRLAIDIEKTARRRRNSKGNLLQIFEEDYEPEETTVVSAEELSQSNIAIDEDFLEASQSNFELELVDFSKEGHDDPPTDEDAS
jgi:CRP-like cAMP-binding protein